jgi:hypothetical protein
MARSLEGLLGSRWQAESLSLVKCQDQNTGSHFRRRRRYQGLGGGDVLCVIAVAAGAVLEV